MKYPPFEVTQAAIDQLAELGAVRVDVVEAGCCGTAYAFRVDVTSDGDHVYGCEGARLLVSPQALAVLTGARLDYGPSLKPPRLSRVGKPQHA